ncbi:hypothetical protein FRC07_006950 [Ceratobasidium sp. 392]|nr:hypothetical protein FRC07_006950 [Ceratobasidium sp. 392]
MQCTDISEGVAYLHQNDTIHGDIKGGNVLISSEGVAKLADFGCTELKTSTLCFTTTTSGLNLSMRWATLLEAVTGMVPFHDKDDIAVCFAVAVKQQTPERPQQIPSFEGSEANRLWDLMMNTWAHNPSDRPSSTNVRDAMRNIKYKGFDCTNETEKNREDAISNIIYTTASENGSAVIRPDSKLPNNSSKESLVDHGL